MHPEALQGSLSKPPEATSLLQTLPPAPHTGQWQTQKIVVKKLHIYSLFLSLMFTHRLSISFLHKSSFKIATRKTQLVPNPMVRWQSLWWSVAMIEFEKCDFTL
jgi:hypothetical protein